MTRVTEWIMWPSSAQETFDTGSLQNLPLIVIAASNGLDYKNLALLSTNSTLINIISDHFVPFHEATAKVVVEESVKILKEIAV